MMWYIYLAYFFAGAFLVNGIPHFVHGISGKRFQSPFASPPGVGKSSSLTNLIWGLFNFIIGFMLLFGVGNFRCGLTFDMLITGLGAIVTAITLSLYFGRLHNR